MKALTIFILFTIFSLSYSNLLSALLSTRGISNKEYSPLIANERDIFKDALHILAGRRRDISPILLDTTYDTLGELLLLETNLTFENHLGENIYDDPYFLKAMKEIARIIQENLDVKSLKAIDIEDPKSFKINRIKWVAKYIFELLSDSGRKELDILNLEDFENKLIETKLNLDTLKKLLSDKKSISYVNLLRGVKAAYPYFGGSEDYNKGQESIEFYVYHFSTIKSDPERNFSYLNNVDERVKKLFKKMVDCVTFPDGYIPYQNQANLSYSAAEIDNYNHLPLAYRELIRKEFNELVKLSKRDFIDPDVRQRIMDLISLFERENFNLEFKIQDDHEFLERFWSKASITSRTELYRKILQISWSTAHIPNEEKKKEYIRIANLVYGNDIAYGNIAGLRENLLMKPKEAGEIYKKDLLNVFPDGIVPARTFIYSGMEKEQPVWFYVDDMVEKHTNWYNNIRKAYKPIIGGTSGTTLVYLNIYRDALAKCVSKGGCKDAPSLEVLRTIMLGGLIGAKKHHSYDEVMIATHAMPDPQYGKTLRYDSRMNYADIYQSSQKNIVFVALQAMLQTIEDINNAKIERSVWKLLKTKVFNDRPLLISQIQQLLVKYVKSQRGVGLDNPREIGKQIIDLVNQNIKLLLI